MTVMREAIDTTTLGWIKPELDETLRLAQQEIEAYAENPADTSRMRHCADQLHQVHGTLRMVELYAPAMVAEEMERLALALQQGKVADRDEACAALMRGVALQALQVVGQQDDAAHQRRAGRPPRYSDRAAAAAQRTARHARRSRPQRERAVRARPGPSVAGEP